MIEQGIFEVAMSLLAKWWGPAAIILGLINAVPKKDRVKLFALIDWRKEKDGTYKDGSIFDDVETQWIVIKLQWGAARSKGWSESAALITVDAVTSLLNVTGRFVVLVVFALIPLYYTFAGVKPRDAIQE